MIMKVKYVVITCIPKFVGHHIPVFSLIYYYKDFKRRSKLFILVIFASLTHSLYDNTFYLDSFLRAVATLTEFQSHLLSGRTLKSSRNFKNNI